MNLIDRARNILFQKERSLFNKERSLLNNEIRSLKRELQVCRDNAEKTAEMLKYITSDFHKRIIFISTNKFDEQIFVVWHYNKISDTSFDLYLYQTHNYRGLGSLPFVSFTLYDTRKLPCYTGEHECYIKIDDICMLTESNRGNGSIAIEGVKRMAAFYDAQYIKGDLSPVDKDRFEQLEHFYSKQGFKVTFNSKRTSGKIYLEV